MNNKETVKLIVEYLGGKSNILSVMHCSTRLRFELKDLKKVHTDLIKTISGIVDAFYGAGQYQIIIGNHVSIVYNELCKAIDFDYSNNKNEGAELDLSIKGIFNRFSALITGIFQPIVPAIAGAGMLKVLLLLMVNLDLTNKTSQTYLVLNLISDSAYYFLPLLLAFSCAQKFKTNPFISVTLAGVLVHPKLIDLLSNGGGVKFVGLEISPFQYSASVIPIVLTIWLMSYVEKIAEKITPGPVNVFLKPLLILIIVSPISLIFLGPVGSYLGQGLSYGIFWIQSQVGWLATALLAIVMPFIVMFGMHKVFYPIVFAAMASPGYETLVLSAMLASNAAQGSGALAIWLLTKDAALKQMAFPSGISALLGISEPALYGVHMRLKKSLLGCMIGAGCAGLFAGIVVLKGYAPISPGLVSLPMFLGEPNNIYYAVITILISTLITPVAIYILNIKYKFIELHESESKEQCNHGAIKFGDSKKSSTKNRIVIFSPMAGNTIPLTEVSDIAFNKLGKGVAIQPTQGIVTAPFDGFVQTLFQTKHSIGLKSIDGVELLIHVGIDTTKLNGDLFKNYVSIGDAITHGQKLIEFDLEAIKSAGYDTTTPVIILNASDYLDVICNEHVINIRPSKPLLTVL